MKLIAVAAMVLSTAAVAQPDKDWWACQVVHSSGMQWESNRWVTGAFKKRPPFVLMSDGNGSITTESVAAGVYGRPEIADLVTCQPSPNYIEGSYVTCLDNLGSTLFFDPKQGKGGFSIRSGSINTGSRRDSVAVDAFKCTKG